MGRAALRAQKKLALKSAQTAGVPGSAESVVQVPLGSDETTLALFPLEAGGDSDQGRQGISVPGRKEIVPDGLLHRSQHSGQQLRGEIESAVIFASPVPGSPSEWCVPIVCSVNISCSRVCIVV